MGYFNDRKNVEDYIRMAEGYDGRKLLVVLKKHLPAGSTVLELGMGPGVDFDLLAETYTVTGSDSSSVFLELYQEKKPTADLLKLDAASIETVRRFDCIYSNKVLHHLTKQELQRSFSRQGEMLTSGGFAMHSFWLGEGEEVHHGLRFVYYMEDELLNYIGSGFDVVATERYEEIEEADSFYILLRRK